MSMQTVKRQFDKIGARAKLRFEERRAQRTDVSIDVGHDDEGEFFDISLRQNAGAELSVVDARPQMRHLLLMSRQHDGKHKFLCGHDERHWFVAAVPERLSVSNVKTAFEALKPQDVRQRQEWLKVKRKNRNRRRNEAFVRQGEWFFLPMPASFEPDPRIVLANEPLRRGMGKPHVCEELVRQGGEVVYVSVRYPNGVTEAQFRKLTSRNAKLRDLNWSAQRRNPGVFVRGKVRHADHKTIVLTGWHQVLMNTETQSVAMRHVAFID